MFNEFENDMEVKHEQESLDRQWQYREDSPIKEEDEDTLSLKEAAKESLQVLRDDELDLDEKIYSLAGVAEDLLPDEPSDRQRMTATSALTGAIIALISARLFGDPMTIHMAVFASLKSAIERAAILAADEAMKNKRESTNEAHHEQS